MARFSAKSNIQRWASGLVGFVVPALAIGLPILYVIGRVYKEAYWNALGVPYTLLGYTVEEYVYWGFVAIVNGLLRLAGHLPLGPLGTWLAAMGMVMVLLLLTFFLRNAIRKSLVCLVSAIEEKAGKLRTSDNAWHKQFAMPLLTLGQWINSAYFAFLVLVLVLSLPIVGASSAGKQQAKKTHFWLLDYQKRKARIQPHEGGKSSIEGNAVVECTGTWCVVADERRLVVISASDIGRIEGAELDLITQPMQEQSKDAN